MIKRVASTTCIALTLAGCTMAPRIRPLSPDLMVGSMGSTTRFEREMKRPIDEDDGSGQKATRALFWTGVVLGVAGAAGTIAFGAAGAAMDNKLGDGFDDGMTLDEEQTIRDRGKAFNGIAVGSLTAALIGVSLAAIVYGVDYSRCGPLAPKKRKCKELKGE